MEGGDSKRGDDGRSHTGGCDPGRERAEGIFGWTWPVLATANGCWQASPSEREVR